MEEFLRHVGATAPRIPGRLPHIKKIIYERIETEREYFTVEMPVLKQPWWIKELNQEDLPSLYFVKQPPKF